MEHRGQPPEPFRDIELPDGSDPISKGIVRRVRIDDGIVTVEAAIEGLGEDISERVIQQLRGAALALEDAQHARVIPVECDDAEVELPEIDHVIAVASAKGGVGKTTVAVALARTLSASGYDVGLFDADIYGPNVPHLLGDAEGPILTNEHGQPVPLEADGIQMLSPGVAAGDPPTARRGAIAYGAVENLLAQGAWDDRDVLVVDLPAGSDDVVGAALEHVPVDGAVFVTTPFDASVDDTRRTLELFEANGVATVAGVVNMSTFECDCCGAENDLFEGGVDIDAPTVYELPFDRTLQRNPGGESSHEDLSALAATVESFFDEVLADLPEDAIDLRGLPSGSQTEQLSDELAFRDSGGRVRAAVENPTTVEAALREDASDLLATIERREVATTGGLLELRRA